MFWLLGEQEKPSHGNSIGRNPMLRVSALFLCCGIEPPPGKSSLLSWFIVHCVLVSWPYLMDTLLLWWCAGSSRGTPVHGFVLGTIHRLRENPGRVFPWL